MFKPVGMNIPAIIHVKEFPGVIDEQDEEDRRERTEEPVSDRDRERMRGTSRRWRPGRGVGFRGAFAAFTGRGRFWGASGQIVGGREAVLFARRKHAAEKIGPFREGRVDFVQQPW